MPPKDEADRAAGQRSPRSTLSRSEARERYLQIGEVAALEQIRLDSEALDARAVAIGPFARLDAEAVAARDGKTRGAITNLFGSQAAYQIETMATALSATGYIEQLEYPSPEVFDRAEDWVDACFAVEVGRGPIHGAEPDTGYAGLWALWLSTVPYGLWSEEIARPSMEEQRLWMAKLATAFAGAMDHFGLELHDGVGMDDLVCAAANLVEGHWLNQCLTHEHPTDPSEPVSTALRRGGRLLWAGATRPASLTEPG